MTNHHPWLKTSPEAVRGPLDRVSWDAAGLWNAVQLYMADTGADGSLRKRDLSVATARRLSASRCTALVDELVEEGLWEDAGDRVRTTHWEQPDLATWTDPEKRKKWALDKQLMRDTELRERIKKRDRNLCRYCGLRVNWSDKKGPTGGTYDHVDPDVSENTLTGIVVACRRCNGRKGHRTPDQAGMPLLKPGQQPVLHAASADGTDTHDLARAGPAPPSELGPDLDRIQIGSKSDLDRGPDRLARTRETGPIQIGSESQPSPVPGRTVASPPSPAHSNPNPAADLNLPRALIEMLQPQEGTDVRID